MRLFFNSFSTLFFRQSLLLNLELADSARPVWLVSLRGPPVCTQLCNYRHMLPCQASSVALGVTEF